MARPELTYEQYRSCGGTLSQNVFAVRIAKAAIIVDYLIGINDVTDADKYREAVFAALDAYNEAESVGNGFSIGSFSLSGASAEGGANREAVEAAYKVLATTGMLYAGIA